MKNFKLIISFVIFIGSIVCPYSLNAESYDGYSTVYVIRPYIWNAFNGKYNVVVNGIQVGKLKNKQYVKCIVPSGDTEVGVTFNNNDEIRFNTESGKEYFIVIDASVEVTGGGMRMNFGFGSKNNLMSSNQTTKTTISVSKYMEASGREILSKCKLLNEVEVDQYPEGDVEYDVKDMTKEILEQVKAEVKNQDKTVEELDEIVRSSDVDINVPVTGISAENTFVLIIANEKYEFVDDVQFALNDGDAMREYCIKTLGVPERQVWFYKNASAGIIAGGVAKIAQAMDIFDDAKAIVYYCGHGIPDEKTGEAYIVPTDGQGTNITTCYSLNKLYKTLSDSKASSITYFMDACFTGANREGSMLVAARGVAREAKKEIVEGNAVVFSAASGDETAMPYVEKQHGLFTYFLLKKMQETRGEVSYGELADYIKSNVKREAFLTNEKPQNPVVATSEDNKDTWESIKLR